MVWRAHRGRGGPTHPAAHGRLTVLDPHPRRHRRHLWIQIYLAILGGLCATALFFAVVGKTLWGGGDGRDEAERIQGIGEVIAVGLPDDPALLGPALQRRADQLGLRLALHDAAGRRLATSDPALPLSGSTLAPGQWLHTKQGPVVAVRLPDGRTLVGGVFRPGRYRRGTHLLLFGGLLLFLAILSRPLARRLTRRLERLQAGVDSWGAGDLSARVCVEGHDEVARLAVAFNGAAERIEGLVTAQQRMLASASHELRSPLARLRVAVELLADDEAPPSGERRARLLVTAQSDVAELDGLIEDLLLVGRLRASDPAARRREDLDLYALSAEVAARFGVAVDGVPTPLSGDERALRRLLRNLLENAEKHGGGAANVEVRPCNGGAELIVQDRGPGVPEAQRERIFEPFHRATAHDEGADGGVGLGLALVREIARGHGGDARCEAREGGGARFVVTLGRG